jgi:hypothetical protein
MASKEYRLKQLVAEACELKRQENEAKKKIAAISKKAKLLAKELKMSEVVSKEGVAKFSPNTKTSCDSEDLYSLLVELGRSRDFVEMVTPKIKEVRDRLGSSIAEEVIVTSSKPFDKVTYKPN